MNTRQRKTLSAIFADPINGNIEWRSIESLLIGLDCQIIEGSGSRVTFLLNGQRADFHRPIPARKLCAIVSKMCVSFCKEQV